MTDSRDPLDLIISEATRQANELPGLPAPGPAEPTDEALLRFLDGPSEDSLIQTQLRQEATGTPWARSRTQTLSEALRETETSSHRLTPSSSEATPDLGVRARAAEQVRIAFARADQGLQFLWGTIQPTSLTTVQVPTRGTAGPEATSRAAGAVEESTFFDFAHHFGPLEVRIQVERLPDDRIDVQLDFHALKGSGGILRVDLTDAKGALIDSQPVEHGTARFAALAPAPHDLLIRAEDTRIGQVRFDVRA